MRRVLVSLVLLSGILTVPTISSAAPSTGETYIVVLKPGVEQSGLLNAVLKAGGRVNSTYQNAINGFSAQMPYGLMTQLQRDSRVVSVEADQIFTLEKPVTDDVGVTARTTSPTAYSFASWGIDRIDETSLPLDSTYSYNSTGENATAYVIDTGTRATHQFLDGRVLAGVGFVGDSGTSDCNGHGTHVSGTIAGISNYGIAPKVSVVPVRVFSCSGGASTTTIVDALNWVASQSTKGVVSMSLGGGASSAIDAAVNGVIDAGFVVVVAAGNDNRDACNFSPARVSRAITVGATASDDSKASYSNYGPCVDIFAPGSSITSAWYTSDTATNTISGTSMATPHVSGAVARYMSKNPSWTRTDIQTWLLNSAALNSPVRMKSQPKPTTTRMLYVPPAD